MTTQHTPGPWTSAVSLRNKVYPYLICDADGVEVARAITSHDGHLLAAAPDLLAALRQAATDLDAAADFFDDKSHECRELRRQAVVVRAAIAKATGGAS